MDKREKRSNDTRTLLEDVANTRWLFYCPGDKTFFMISAESSGWPKDLTLHRKLSLQKHAKIQIRNPVTRKFHECSLIDSGTEEFLRKVEAKGAKSISNMQETLLGLSFSFTGEENVAPVDTQPERTQRSYNSEEEDEEPPLKRVKQIAKPKPVFKQSPIVLYDNVAPLTSTPCKCDGGEKVSSCGVLTQGL